MIISGASIRIPPNGMAADISSPAQLPGLQLWTEGDLGVTLNVGTVAQWADQSGAANDISEASAPNQPTYVAVAQNGLPGVQFVNANATRLSRAVNIMGAGPLTFGLVIRVDAVTGSDVYIANEDAAVGGLELARNAPNWTVTAVNSSGQNDSAITTGTFQIITGVLQANASRLRINGAEKILSPMAASLVNPGAGARAVLGARNNGGAFSLFSSSTICASIMGNQAANTSQLRGVERFWSNKWAIALS